MTSPSALDARIAVEYGSGIGARDGLQRPLPSEAKECEPKPKEKTQGTPAAAAQNPRRLRMSDLKPSAGAPNVEADADAKVEARPSAARGRGPLARLARATSEFAALTCRTQ